MKQENELPTALPAIQLLLWGGRWLLTLPVVAALRRMLGAGASLQERPDLRERFTPARAQDAVGADFDEALGPHVLEEAADERFSRQRLGFQPCAPALLEAQGALPVCKRFQAIVGARNSRMSGARSVRTFVPVPAG